MNIVKRIIIYCIGLFFLAMGVTFSIKTQLGISPVNSIPYIISLITGIEQGRVIIVVFSIFILMQIVMLRKQFEIKNLFQIVFSVIFGSFVTFTNSIFYFEAPESYIIRLVLLFISMVFIAVGVLLFLRAEILPMPAEGCMLAIKTITNKEFHTIKSIFDTTMVVISIVLSVVFLGGLVGIREGTIISAIFTGKIIGWIEKTYCRQINGLTEFLAL